MNLKMYMLKQTNPLPKTATMFDRVISPDLRAIFLPNAVMVQNRNKMVNALHNADIKLIMKATWLTSAANKLKNLPIN